jgi:hypothetical protein
MIVVVDAGVLAAQRAYGAYLAAAPGAQASAALELAIASYRELLSRAVDADGPSRYELARLLSEPETLSNLGIEPVDVLLVVPNDWIETLVGRRPFTIDELAGLAEALRSRGDDESPAMRPLIARAVAEHDVAGLIWLTQHASEPVCSEAFGELGRILHTQAIELNASAGRSAAPPHEIQELVAAMDQWRDDSRRFKVDAGLRTDVDAQAELLRNRQVLDEAVWLTSALNNCFSNPVADQAMWLDGLDHLTRLADCWLEESGGIKALTEAARQLRAARETAVVHGRAWGQKHALLQLSQRRPIEAIAGTCAYCGSWMMGPSFCRRCGANR